ncbi:cytochrome c oxidase assembly protein [Salibacterium salarium]|nr:cytochrome c oxidase assembly protein [Salibacterium salarium]
MFYDILLGGQLTWNTTLLTVFISVAVFYILIVKRWTNLNMNEKTPLLFLLGLGILYITTGSPFTAISHFAFSLHMLQMSILFFIIPPLLILGIPEPLFQQIGKNPIIKSGSKLFFPPMIALSIFAVLFLMYHTPFVLEILSQSPFLRDGYTFLLFILSLRMWWPLTAPDSKQRLDRKQKKRYAFWSGLFIMPACLLFIFNALVNSMNNPFLAEKTAHLCLPPASSDMLLPPLFNSTFDQLTAGILMLAIHKLGLLLVSHLDTKGGGHRFPRFVVINKGSD